MKILVLGGTGAMGVYLVDRLTQQGHAMTVTSRSERQSRYNNLKYVQGDAHNNEFLKTLLAQNYDAIVDFMVYSTAQFAERYKMILDATGQYVFFSSSRVYTNSNVPITEKTPRLLDVCKADIYLKTDEYALSKARQEDLLMESERGNWTIIRPYITYSNTRLQLGIFEKEWWLQRALQNKSIVFCKDIASCRTTLTYGDDVSNVISLLVGNEKAYRKAVNITGPNSMQWSEVLDVYLDVLEKKTGKRPTVFLTENADNLKKAIPSRRYQIEYDRLYNRVFDNSLVEEICGTQLTWKPMREGLSYCLTEFLNGPHMFLGRNSRFEAWSDKQTGEHTNLSEFSGWKNKLKYFIFRL